MEKTVNAGEIDLLELAARFLNALRRNLILTFLLPIVGLVAALSFAYGSKDLFQSEMMIETSLLSEKECEFFFNQLNKVPEFPGITPEIAAHVHGLKYEVVKNDAASNNTTDKSIYLKITATVSQKAIFTPLEGLVIQFINEAEPVVRHRKDRERFYNSMILKIDSEIAAMDQIKKQVDGSKQATFLDPSELYKGTVALYKEKTEYEIKLNEIRNVHLVKGFDSLTIDAKLSKVIVGAIGLVLGFALLSLILFLKFFIGYYSRYRASH